MSDIEVKLDDLLRRAQAEVADVDLFAPPPPNEECPICFLPCPHDELLSVISDCCGKLMCSGCLYKQVTLLRPREILGPKHVCAFCRTPVAVGPDRIERMEKLMQNRNPLAFMNMADDYRRGNGVPQDERKALEMFAQAAILGGPAAAAAYSSIGRYYRDGLVVAKDESKSLAFLEVAAKKGSTISHHRLAESNVAMGEIGSAIKHYKVAACAGFEPSLTALVKAFKDDLLSKKEIERCLRAFQISDNEMKSEDRDAYLDTARSNGLLGSRGEGSGGLNSERTSRQDEPSAAIRRHDRGGGRPQPRQTQPAAATSPHPTPGMTSTTHTAETTTTANQTRASGAAGTLAARVGPATIKMRRNAR